MATPLIVNAVTLGLSSAFGGLAGTRVFVTDAHIASDLYFEAYYPHLVGANTDEARNKKDAFRHAFVSGSLAMETSDSYAHFWGDLYELWTINKNTPQERNMDLWNNEIGRTLAQTATDSDSLAALVFNAIETNLTINDPVSDTREYSGQDIVLTEEAVEILLELSPEDFLGNIDDENTAVLPTWSIQDTSSIFNILPDWLVNNVLPLVNAARNEVSPLILDLDGDGVELISLDNTTVYWDLDQDGMAEATGWAAGDDGLLAYDWNGDGAITAAANDNFKTQRKVA